jgi:hypothetical protein
MRYPHWGDGLYSGAEKLKAIKLLKKLGNSHQYFLNLLGVNKVTPTYLIIDIF